MFFKIKQKLWENVPKEATFKCPVSSCKTSQILYLLYVYYAHVYYAPLVNKLKCEANLTLIHVISNLPFATAMFRRPFWELALKFFIIHPVQVISVFGSNGCVNALSTYEIKSILLLTLDFAADSSSCS